MCRVQRTCATGARAIGVPGWPEFAFCTASAANILTVSMPKCSISFGISPATAGLLVEVVVDIYAISRKNHASRQGGENNKGKVMDAGIGHGDGGLPDGTQPAIRPGGPLA